MAIAMAIAIMITIGIAILAVQGTRDFVGGTFQGGHLNREASAAFSTRAHDRPGRVGPGGVEQRRTGKRGSGLDSGIQSLLNLESENLDILLELVWKGSGDCSAVGGW